MSEARTLPHHSEVETSILSVLLDGRDPDSLRSIRSVLGHPLYFWTRDHRFVYLAMLELDDAGNRTDYVTVSEYLSRYKFTDAVVRLREIEATMEATVDGTLDRKRLLAILRRPREDSQQADSVIEAIGGNPGLVKITDAFGSLSALEANARILADLYSKRRYIQSMSRLVDNAYATRKPFSDLLAETSKTLMGLTKLDHKTSTVLMPDLARDIPTELRDRMQNPITGVTTGFTKIDEILINLRPGGLYIVAARPGVGKTSWALNVARHVASGESPGRVVFFALEMTPRDLAAKVVTSIARVDFDKYRAATVTEDEFSRIEIAATDTSYLIEMPEDMDLDVHAARGLARRCVWDDSRPPVRLIVIDYLQLFAGSTPGQDEYSKINEISRVLKMMALELNVPVIALSQMSRDIEKGSKPREPRLSDLRGSGSIEQDANAVIFLHRDTDSMNIGGQVLKVIVSKHRDGRTGDALYTFHGATMTYEDRAAPEDDDAPIAGSGRSQRLIQQPTADEDLFNGDAEPPR